MKRTVRAAIISVACVAAIAASAPLVLAAGIPVHAITPIQMPRLGSDGTVRNSAGNAKPEMRALTPIQLPRTGSEGAVRNVTGNAKPEMKALTPIQLPRTSQEERGTAHLNMSPEILNGKAALKMLSSSAKIMHVQPKLVVNQPLLIFGSPSAPSNWRLSSGKDPVTGDAATFYTSPSGAVYEWDSKTNHWFLNAYPSGDGGFVKGHWDLGFISDGSKSILDGQGHFMQHSNRRDDVSWIKINPDGTFQLDGACVAY